MSELLTRGGSSAAGVEADTGIEVSGRGTCGAWEQLGSAEEGMR